jgi:hypothetical protein
MKTSESQLPPDPKAVILARVFLIGFGFISLMVGGAMWIGMIFSPGWWATAAAIVVGIGCLISALLEGPRSVVATFLIFFFPWT